MTDAAGSTRVILGVAGGIAAYKACELLRLLTESGHRVRVIPTDAALRFVGAPTWEALSGEPVTTTVWSDVDQVAHVRLGREAELVVIAPATADLLARAAHGRADDLLTATLLTARCPVLFAPAMHSEMWDHPATQANVATLRARGNVVLTPASGRLTGADSGVGRLPDPAEIFAAARSLLLHPELDLAGRHVVVSAGGTREPLDPVRFLGNRSSGRQGYALAAAAAARGAHVTVVAANVSLPDPAGATVVRISTAAELRTAVLTAAAEADVVVMAAAVADFRPVSSAAYKIKRGATDPEPLALVRNPDVLADLVAARGTATGPVLVGFAAETDDVLARGRTKLASKGCDLLVVNEVGEDKAFDLPDNAAVILGVDGSETEVPYGPKDRLAHVVWDQVTRLLPQS
ncbi:bifunctional phosphopantothenoylcysteine decarboxylase/phosphopantothenate--cysteine ligase CoaBC [Acidothermaceae bacterium B102]|nr:bifunctional phosphopantothenoylcysteine decarboxylase/phosphopantothenate--cysteine ligase CoaBC [Acidothermaceae bacterium B102]